MNAILVYNQKEFWSSNEYSERQTLLSTHYRCIFVSSNETVALYKLKE